MNNILYKETEKGYKVIDIIVDDEMTVIIPSVFNCKKVYGIQSCAIPARVQKIHIPETIIEINKNAFEMATDLEYISVEQLNPVFSSLDGILYSKDKSTLFVCPQNYRKFAFLGATNTTEISQCAFYANRNLSMITFDNLSSIQPLAFSNSNIEQISISSINGYVNEGAFSYCDKLKTVEIGEGWEFGKDVFKGTDLSSIIVITEDEDIEWIIPDSDFLNRFIEEKMYAV